MATRERYTRLSRDNDEQVEVDNQPMQQSLDEFVALHTEAALATSSGRDEDRENETKTEDNEEDNEDNNAPHQKQKKRVRYLCDADRHTIIQRIEKGEKQADLAREYGVTRAAICHIKKNRDEIITRYDSLIRQAQEIHRTESFAEPEEDSMVREIQSSSVLLLMTTLRDRRSEPETFRRAAGRLIMMLLEEALSIIGVHSIEMTTATGYVTYGLGRTDEFCGVAIGAEGFPFLVLFHQMEPDASQGSIHVKQETDEQGASVYRLNHVDLPSDIARYRVLLFSSTVNTGDTECKAIETLCSLGVQEGRITLVIILCSTDSLEAICNRFPGTSVALPRILRLLISLYWQVCGSSRVASTARSTRRRRRSSQGSVTSLRGIMAHESCGVEYNKHIAIGFALNNRIATTLAVRAASRLDPIQFCEADVSLSDLVTTHVVLGGATSATSSRVLDGVLLPVTDAPPRNVLQRRISSSAEISITGGVVVLAGDLDSLEFTTNSSVHVIFVHGGISPPVIDASVSTTDAPLCIPVSSYNSLRQLAEMSGAEIVDSWDELLPNAIGHECLQMKTLEFSVSRSQDDELASSFVQIMPDTRCQQHVSVIVQGPTKSLAEELRNETIKVISRLRNALRSGYVLPGNGGFWCACAAAVKQEAKALAQWMHYFEAQSHHIDVAMAATSPTAGAGSPKKAGMPRRQTAVVPLDYSFMGLTSLSEMQQHDPVCGTKKVISVNALTTRSRGGAGDGLASPTGVKVSTTAGTSPTKKRQTPVSLRVNNNKISSLNDMQEALCAVFDYPEMLQWLDLSGNVLSSIPPDVFSAYPDLFTLHLHGNQLSKYSDIDALAKWLPRLHSISLHGNPLEEKKHYRNYVISSFPNLKQLNFSSVTLGDRDKAETWTGIYKNARNGGKSRDDDL
ncbi:Leucine-rich repeat domain, L domain-like [Phytophthora cactorum]|nr:Leucine-rich repeat domain, L domain-like [Phytophthora cactorum]